MSRELRWDVILCLPLGFLFCISFVLVVAVYVIYWKGPTLRQRSPFAQRLAEARTDHDGRRASVTGNDPERRRRGKLTTPLLSCRTRTKEYATDFNFL